MSYALVSIESAYKSPSLPDPPKGRHFLYSRGTEAWYVKSHSQSHTALTGGAKCRALAPVPIL